MGRTFRTCDEISVVELAHGVRLEPGYLVAEEAVEDGVSFLRQRPGIADIHLCKEKRDHSY